PSAFSAPVLVIGGTSDALVTSETISTETDRFAKGRKATVTNSGHWPHVEQPSQVANLISAYLKDLDWSLPLSEQASDWKRAFSEQSATAFGAAVADDVILETSFLLKPARGREEVKRIMEAGSKLYEILEFTDQAIEGSRQYLQWRACAMGGVKVDGVTILT